MKWKKRFSFFQNKNKIEEVNKTVLSGLEREEGWWQLHLSFKTGLCWPSLNNWLIGLIFKKNGYAAKHSEIKNIFRLHLTREPPELFDVDPNKTPLMNYSKTFKNEKNEKYTLVFHKITNNKIYSSFNIFTHRIWNILVCFIWIFFFSSYFW